MPELSAPDVTVKYRMLPFGRNRTILAVSRNVQLTRGIPRIFPEVVSLPPFEFVPTALTFCKIPILISDGILTAVDGRIRADIIVRL